METSQDGYLWLKKEENHVLIGLTDKAIDDWGKIEFMSLPPVGMMIDEGDSLAEVEAEKAVTEIPSPVTGKVAKTYSLDESSDRRLIEIKA